MLPEHHTCLMDMQGAYSARLHCTELALGFRVEAFGGRAPRRQSAAMQEARELVIGPETARGLLRALRTGARRHRPVLYKSGWGIRTA